MCVYFIRGLPWLAGSRHFSQLPMPTSVVSSRDEWTGRGYIFLSVSSIRLVLVVAQGVEVLFFVVVCSLSRAI
ncbi:hypothetical protein BDV38DRAFT_239935, partial [Aspergillus pseudotamarii]